jgi:hypothetical protein
MKKRIFVLVTVMFLLSINPALSQNRAQLNPLLDQDRPGPLPTGLQNMVTVNLTINPVLARGTVLIRLTDGTTLTDAHITTEKIVVSSDYVEQKIIAFNDIKEVENVIAFSNIREIEFNQLKKEGKVKIIFKNGSVLENAGTSLSKLDVESKVFGKLVIPVDRIQSIFSGDKGGGAVDPTGKVHYKGPLTVSKVSGEKEVGIMDAGKKARMAQNVRQKKLAEKVEEMQLEKEAEEQVFKKT